MASTKEDSKSALKKRRLKQVAVILFILFNILIIYWTASKELTRDKESVGEFSLQIWLLAPALIAFLAHFFCEVYKYYIVIQHFSKKKDWRLALETVLIGRYYDNVTPSAIGGQPFQIYHMRKNGGIEKEHADIIPVIGFISMQAAFVTMSLLVILFGANIVISDVAYAASYFGIILYSFSPVSVIFFALKPKAATKLTSGAIRFLHKLHIVRDFEKTEAMALARVEGYASSIRRVIKNKKLALKVMGLSFAGQILLYSIPFLVVTAFGGSIGYLPAIMTAITIQTAISFVPTPGNAGVAEGSFYLVFATLGNGDAFWAMLTWRFFSYYSFIILGALLYLNLGIEKRRRALNEGHSANSTK